MPYNNLPKSKIRKENQIMHANTLTVKFLIIIGHKILKKKKAGETFITYFLFI